jgi:tetratricopeptide (TPR) repeat protein
MVESQQDKTAATKQMNLRLYIRQQPVMLALLAVFGVIFFLAVAGLSRAYHAQRSALGNRWFSRGVVDLHAGRYDRAVTEFRAALLYSRDNYDYQLNLAEALTGLKRTDEAYSYLVNLWDRQPENGVVNLELSRIAAQRGQTEQAQRYYHNAIYAVWPGDQELKRRDTRFELIEYLLNIHAKAQAQAELIALEENLGEDPALQKRVGDLFLRAEDYEHALAAYRVGLKSDRHNQGALAGAGWAAFQLGRYPLAERYLQAAVAANPGDRESAERLLIVVDAFAVAGRRLSSCATPKPAEGSIGAQTSLADSWAKLKPRLSEQELRRDPDLVEQAMELVFEIERQTSATCGTPTGTDLALLLIAKLHEGT